MADILKNVHVCGDGQIRRYHPIYVRKTVATAGMPLWSKVGQHVKRTWIKVGYACGYCGVQLTDKAPLLQRTVDPAARDQLGLPMPDMKPGEHYEAWPDAKYKLPD